MQAPLIREFSWGWGQSIAYFAAGVLFVALGLLPLPLWMAGKPGIIGWSGILIYECLFLPTGLGFALFRRRLLVDPQARTVRRETRCAGFPLTVEVWSFSDFSVLELRVEVAGTNISGAGYIKTRTAELWLVVGERKEFVQLDTFFMPIRTDVPPEATALAKELGAVIGVPVKMPEASSGG